MFNFLQAIVVVDIVFLLRRKLFIALFKVTKDLIYFLTECGVVAAGFCATKPDFVLIRPLLGLLKGVENNL